MRHILLGMVIGLVIVASVSAFGARPYDDTQLQAKINKLGKALEQVNRLNAKQNRLNIKQKKDIKYLEDVLTEHKIVIIYNQDSISELKENTIKDIKIMK